MKKRLPPFAAGMLTAALIGGLGLSALAASGQMTITVDPINIQVNGQTFQPKDATGADVPVFAYNGTTYAPLRALAEAYGLEVGYDAQANMATVGAKAGNDVQPTTPPDAPDNTTLSNDYSDWTAEEEAAYQEFKEMWEVEIRPDVDTGDYKVTPVFGHYQGNMSKDELIEHLGRIGVDYTKKYVQRLGAEFLTDQHMLRFVLWYDNTAIIEVYFTENQLGETTIYF